MARSPPDALVMFVWHYQRVGRCEVVARVLEDGGLECSVVSPRGAGLTLTGRSSDIEPTVDGTSADLIGNRALVHNAWAFAKFTHAKVNRETSAEQKFAARQAKAHRAVTTWLAEVAEDITYDEKHGWCSGCFGKHSHRRSNRPLGHLPVYVCRNCGTPTLRCAGPGCTNMALRGRGPVRVPRYCAEHRHEVPGFEKACTTMGALENYESFLDYDKPHLGRRTRMAGATVAAFPIMAGAAFFAAAAVGGAVGTLVGGYSGAAATSYGLALLGGGSIASGGLGMAGGTLVVTALGGALGSALGASVAHAYLCEDRSFRIEKLRGGAGVPVVVCNGFLTEGDEGWAEWKDLVAARYPDSPVFRVHWGAKELKQLGIVVGAGAAKMVAGTALKQTAAQATRAGAKLLSPLTPVFLLADAAKNPWLLAKNRAEKTGVIVADLLARTDADSYVLVGHSLGARAMTVAVQTLGSRGDSPKVQAAHLLGAAIGANSDWHTLVGGVADGVFNYHSRADGVLKYLYRVAEGGQAPAGLTGFSPTPPKLTNVDVSERVRQHSDYFAGVTLL